MRPDSLGCYVRTFNAVEGNTTFHARPAPATVQRWAATMPEDFREQVQATHAFLELLAPLGARVAPL